MIDRNISPRGFDQPYLWFADYGTGILNRLTEFEDSGKENKFTDIDKDNVKKFGILGRGTTLFFDTSNGIFDIYHNKIQFIIECEDGTIVDLSNQNKLYNDLITYKMARNTSELIDVNVNLPEPIDKSKLKFGKRGTILGYFFGYKFAYTTDANEINAKIIFSLPMEKEKKNCFNIRVVSKERLVGKFNILVNNEKVVDSPIDFAANEAQEFNWVIDVQA